MSPLPPFRLFLILLLLGALGLGGLSSLGWLSPGALAPAAPTATVSGVIRHSGSPVSGVAVTVNWTGGNGTSTTNASGFYSVGGVPTGGKIQMAVRPPIAMRLEFRNWSTDPLSGDLTKDFDLRSGYLLQGEFHIPGGALYNQTFWMQALPVIKMIPSGEWMGITAISGAFQLVLAPDVYFLKPNNPPVPYFEPRAKVDLRTSDQTGVVITLLDERPAAIPILPPDASRISVSAPGIDGIATVTGLSGAVEPLSDAILVNLNSRNLQTTLADSNGAFSASIFAPPGSTLMVKYDPEDWRTDKLLAEIPNTTGAVTYLYVNPLPGTMLNVGPPTPGAENSQAFTAAGGFVKDPSLVDHGKWAGWWISGQVQAPSGPPLQANPGQQINLNNFIVHVTSPAFNCSTDVNMTVNVSLSLRYLFGADGRPLHWGVWFNSYLFTPTGLPIEREGNGQVVGVLNFPVTGFTCESRHTAVSSPLSTSFTVPASLPVGAFQIQAFIGSEDVTQADVSAAPFVYVWYQQARVANLPVLTVGDPAAPRIPWVLLGDYPVDGRRGVTAREHAGIYAMPDRVITSPERYVIPRDDPRTGEPLVYNLEPGSHWLSATDRRFPNPPRVQIDPANGGVGITIFKPDGGVDTLGTGIFTQTQQRTPVTLDGTGIAEGTGQIADLYNLTTRDDTFDYRFDQYGHHIITLEGTIADIHGRRYGILGTYDIYVARVLDLDPGQLPTTPYVQNDLFSPNLHVYPPFPADLTLRLTHMPYSNPGLATTTTVSGQANRFGYFQPPTGTSLPLTTPGEFRVDVNAEFWDDEGTLWMGSLTWGSVVEKTNPLIEAHGRRGMDYESDTIYDMPAWFEVFNLPAGKVGIENYYPYFSGDVHWGNEDRQPGDSIHSIITFRDLTALKQLYTFLLNNYSRANSSFRWPPLDRTSTGLQKRLDVDEAPLFFSTTTGRDGSIFPGEIDQWGYFYASSERPDVRVRELISEDNMGTAYWRFDDTYNLQIGEGAKGDLPSDLKWEFGGAVLRIPSHEVIEYGVYASLWVLLPHNDPIGARVTPPFQFAAGGMNGGPILTLLGQEIDMLFLPKGVRPGDILQLGETVSFSGHVGPPLDSRVDVVITSPGGVVRSRSQHANKIGWWYDPTSDFAANEIGRWTVDVFVEHDRPYLPTGITPSSHNTGTVLGTSGRYEFYVVALGSPRLYISEPHPGFINWPSQQIEPVEIHGVAPLGTNKIYYTIYDKGMVMGQGTLTPDFSGHFALIYDAEALNEHFPMLSLTAHEGNWEGLADEVSIRFLAVGPGFAMANSVTLIGEEVFVINDHDEAPWQAIFLPVVRK